MKKLTALFCLLMALATILTVAVFAAEYVTMYAPDGRTRQTLKSEVELYKSVGWYANKSDVYVTMYALDGRTRDTLKKEVEAYKKVGWFTEPVTLMYAADGRTRVTLKSEVELYKRVGWYANKSDVYVTMYAADGRTRDTLKKEVEAYKKVGWYANKSDVYVTMYAPDGRTRDTLKKEVEAYKKVGWYANKSDVYVTMYAPDGRTRDTLKKEVEAYKRVGWYTAPVTIMYAPDGRTRVTYKSEVEAYKKVGWYDVPVTILYTANGASRVFPTSEVPARLATGWMKEYANGTRTYPYSAKHGVVVPLQRYSWNPTRSLEITCNRVIRGEAGNYLVARAYSYNQTPSINQEWVVFDLDISYLSSTDGMDDLLEVWYDLFYSDAFYKADGSALEVSDVGEFYNILPGYDVRDAEFYPGGSARVFYAILIDKHVGDILFKVPCNEGEYNVWIKMNSDADAITTEAAIEKYLYATVPESERGININLVDALPKTVNYYNYNGLAASYKVTGFEYTAQTTSAKIVFSGEKTYDYYGSDNLGSSRVGWILYDSRGNFVAEDYAFGLSIKTGEKLNDCSDYINNLAPGEYTLVITDVD